MWFGTFEVVVGRVAVWRRTLVVVEIRREHTLQMLVRLVFQPVCWDLAIPHSSGLAFNAFSEALAAGPLVGGGGGSGSKTLGRLCNTAALERSGPTRPVVLWDLPFEPEPAPN